MHPGRAASKGGEVNIPTLQRCGGQRWGQNISSAYYAHVTKCILYRFRLHTDVFKVLTD